MPFIVNYLKLSAEVASINKYVNFFKSKKSLAWIKIEIHD
jgi:hypothetical protein